MKTTLYTVLCVAIRLGAVLMAVGLLVELPGFLWGTSDSQFVAIGLGVMAIELLIAAVLWLRPGLLAWWAANRQNGEVLESNIGPGQLQYIAFSVLGCWLLISGLANGLQQGIALLLVHARAEIYPLPTLPASLLIGLVKSAATLVAGAALLLGSHGLVGLLHRMRGYPHNTLAETDPDASTTQDG
ncbi:MAG TPA: hypothetical protein VGV14_07615 [Rhodanobacter sp.]|nr:hypothetical protein [Rhodanobacter sp.]